MTDAAPPAQGSRYGHYTPAGDSADVADWIGQHARAHGFELDEPQTHALPHFARLHANLIELERREGSFLRFLARTRRVRGIYLWGGVGRGKSFIMDSFFNCVPLGRKRRVHFHRFMQDIHRALRAHQGETDPMPAVARDVAGKSWLICLDEFHITDITDAMLMRRLLESLFAQGAVLVTTSNFHPDELYRHGLQRGQFLPAIELIKENLETVGVDGGVDYRLRELEKAGVYHVDGDANSKLEQAFAAIARHESDDAGPLEIEGRTIEVRRHARGVAWFDFGALCDGPRGKADYIELARRYHTVLLAGVPRFMPEHADRLRRFVWLVDEFYDRRVKLMLSAAAPPVDLVDGKASADRFQANLNASLRERLVSRLTEMQTREYLTRPHLP